MLSIAICDKNKKDRELLREALLRRLENRGVEALRIMEYSSGEALLADTEGGSREFDILFTEIHLDAMNGIKTAMALREKGVSASIAFVSETSDFAVESYEVNAKGYLLKPFNEGKLFKLLDKLLLLPKNPKLILRCVEGIRFFDYEEIIFIESQNNAIILHLLGGKTNRSREKLVTVERLLCDVRFLRCHQSYIINMDYIVQVEKDFVLKNGARVPIRVRSHKELADRFYEYLKSNKL